jgi:hypothetical protein
LTVPTRVSLSSASGGMSIALDALGPAFVELASASGISLERCTG